MLPSIVRFNASVSAVQASPVRSRAYSFARATMSVGSRIARVGAFPELYIVVIFVYGTSPAPHAMTSTWIPLSFSNWAAIFSSPAWISPLLFRSVMDTFALLADLEDVEVSELLFLEQPATIIRRARTTDMRAMDFFMINLLFAIFESRIKQVFPYVKRL